MKSSNNISPQKSLAREFEQWQKLFYDEVHIFFAKKNVKRGEVALESWEARFTKYLSEQLPPLAQKYQRLRLKNQLYTEHFVSPYYLEGFMSQVGDAIASFLEQCIDDARKGNIDEYRVISNDEFANSKRQKQVIKRNAWKSFFLFPKSLGDVILDLLGRKDARDATATILGWIILTILILLLTKIISLSTLESIWRFFFPPK